ncbi:aldose 1-epimerase isoform X2 [Orussus abietinus]|nr:aldose 1-epimerase isoform X2 [Orussus abietinus]XP_012270681.1 aldose 1-epimerase isoform X2 [Orussus abietinus]XP_012270682.1 aldose 1-epimerase isoform X2 [Orussus abietinus]XP_012270683.1 aldose 1-epimerase isoform X2 [Orussus abietinus]XP_012270684.1 aldose 1-epimerase isoform X2 [Orussus abietinus]
MGLGEHCQIQVADWGSVESEVVKKYTLTNSIGQEVTVISYGATITTIRTPDKNGQTTDVVLGFDNIEGYLAKNNPYFGATIGRVANRIANAQFILDGVEYNLSKNVGNDSLHGGIKGWNARVWNSTIESNNVIMTLLSDDGEEGYPGTVIASAKFCLTEEGQLIIEMKAFTTKATPINLTNHSYFNLAGHDTNSKELYNHVFKINADRWTVTDSESIPTGEIRSVENSVFDLRHPTVLGKIISSVPGVGYDYNFCLLEDSEATKERFVAKVLHPASGRYLEVFSDQPGVQFYTSNYFPTTIDSAIIGKEGKKYLKHGAFCLETQNYPDAVNHANFPNSILRPGKIYSHTVIYKFGVEA